MSNPAPLHGRLDRRLAQRTGTFNGPSNAERDPAQNIRKPACHPLRGDGGLVFFAASPANGAGRGPRAGYNVHLATRVNSDGSAIEELGLKREVVSLYDRLSGHHAMFHSGELSR